MTRLRPLLNAQAKLLMPDSPTMQMKILGCFSQSWRLRNQKAHQPIAVIVTTENQPNFQRWSSGPQHWKSMEQESQKCLSASNNLQFMLVSSSLFGLRWTTGSHLTRLPVFVYNRKYNHNVIMLESHYATLEKNNFTP